ncbi:MAG: TfoX/Sxy family protein [Clostridiales bacterium]|nr:TfoX/Sxy family protein [Clostridiales bacterium]
MYNKSMASTISFVEYVCDIGSRAGSLIAKRLFGEFGLHFDGKYIGAICGDQIFIKPTNAGREVLKTPNEQEPYQGAGIKYFLIEDIDDAEAFTQLLLATWKDLPFPKPKKLKEKK